MPTVSDARCRNRLSRSTCTPRMSATGSPALSGGIPDFPTDVFHSFGLIAMRVSTPSFKLASLAVLTVLAACGGGGSDSGAATPGPTATGTGTQGSAGNTIASTDTTTQSGSNASANTSTPSGNQASTDAAATRPAADTKPTTPAANGTSGTGTAAAPVAPVRPVPPVIQPAPQTAPEVPKPPVTPVAPVTPAEPAKPVTPTASAEQQARKTRGEWLPKVNWPVVSIHAAITADGRVLTYGTDYNVRQDSQFRYDVWDPELGTDDASHMLLLNSTKTFLFCSAQILLQNGRMMIRFDSLCEARCRSSRPRHCQRRRNPRAGSPWQPFCR